jgi:hypothetical protein
MGTSTQSPSSGTPSPDPDKKVLPTVMRDRSTFPSLSLFSSDDVDPSDVTSRWLSVDSETPVSLVLWR